MALPSATAKALGPDVEPPHPVAFNPAHYTLIPVQAGDPQAVAASARQAERLQMWRASAEGQRWAAARGALPICAVRGQLLEALERADVVVVCGETGSGKTCAR